MVILSKDSLEIDVINFVRKFVNLLAEEKYVEAFEMTYNNLEREMSPDLIKALIEGYGFAEPVENNTEPPLRVTHLSKMNVPEPKHQIDWYKSEREIGAVHYDLPLNGEWSDLTAIFDIYNVENGIALSLYDIHVL